MNDTKKTSSSDLFVSACSTMKFNRERAVLAFVHIINTFPNTVESRRSKAFIRSIADNFKSHEEAQKLYSAILNKFAGSPAGEFAINEISRLKLNNQITNKSLNNQDASAQSTPNPINPSSNNAEHLSKSNLIKSVLTILFIGAVIVIGIMLIYNHLTKPSWEKAMLKAKKALVTITTTDALGSGFLISSDGLILTNAHVIHSESDINIEFADGRRKKASIVKTGTPPLDIAILKIDGNDYDYLFFETACHVGEEVMALGSPKGLTESVTKGIISNCNREIESVLFIQTDAPINTGNSGGPLININGDVVAMATFKILFDNAEGMGFGLSMNLAKDFIDNKLLELEDRLAKNEEKKIEAEKAMYKRVADTAVMLYDYLLSVNKAENDRHNKYIISLFVSNLITYDQATVLINNGNLPPQGYNNNKEWIASITFRVLKREISLDEAISLIKGKYIL